MTHETLEQCELLRRESDWLIRAADSASERIENEIADLQPETYFGTITPAQRSNSREQFRKCEWLGQIVIGAAVQSSNFHLDCVSRRQKQDRSRAMLVP